MKRLDKNFQFAVYKKNAMERDILAIYHVFIFNVSKNT